MEPHTLSIVHFCSAFNHLELFWSCLHICLKMWKRHELLVSRNHNFNMLQPWSFLLHTHIAHTKVNIHVDFEASMYRNKKVMDCPKSLKMPFLLPTSIWLKYSTIWFLTVFLVSYAMVSSWKRLPVPWICWLYRIFLKFSFYYNFSGSL